MSVLDSLLDALNIKPSLVTYDVSVKHKHSDGIDYYFAHIYRLDTMSDDFRFVGSMVKFSDFDLIDAVKNIYQVDISEQVSQLKSKQ